MFSVFKAWADVPPRFAERLMSQLTSHVRVYHSLHHINQLLIDADEHASLFVDGVEWRMLQWAILYHDAIYDPLSKFGQNEAYSANEWMRDFPLIYETMLDVPSGAEDGVAEVIRMSADHFGRPLDLYDWEHAFLDLDLGGLGARPPLYEANRLLIHTEYAQAGVSPAQWLEGRVKFIDKALAASRIYHVLYQDREEQARDNLTNELHRLQTTGH